ncbi:hypothetical protein H2201_008592 [Coniosporium apollinis]|uniref:Uncharacterized protein n=1 Tax=Coniosporium apollinis TaxID=61459 RepID=A0ABQ9NFT4_9PEZI|nr:hypothetical protein H2201_008592 [Coniosporium apollinis]
MTALALSYEIVQQSLAQLSGSYLAPVSFSFGWPVYALKLLWASINNNRLMPEPDIACIAINTSNGITRQNKSWVLGRVLRDYETYWRPTEVKKEVDDVIEQARYDRQARENELAAKENREPNTMPKPSQAGLVISIFRAPPDKIPGKPGYDLVYWSGIATTTIQLLIAGTLYGLNRDPANAAILGITVIGTVLAFVTGALPQWAIEKWACRRLSAGKLKTVAITRGMGSQHVLIIDGGAGALDLEDLANPNAILQTMWKTRIWAVISALLWAGLTVFVTSIPNERAWFLLGIGALGSVQNLIAARAPRQPEGLGLPIEKGYKVKVIGRSKVMRALRDLEKDYPGIGLSLLKTFFADDRLTEKEKQEWQTKKEEAAERERRRERDEQALHAGEEPVRNGTAGRVRIETV